jgi:hypothetical protein
MIQADDDLLKYMRITYKTGSETINMSLMR